MTAVKKLDMTNNSVIICQVMIVIAHTRSEKAIHKANGEN